MESSPKKISIIIPAYNEEVGISHTLNLLCHEAYLHDAEIIVINDGSSDKTGQVVSGFKQVKLIDHIFNRGYGSAICTGVRAASGEYVVWFDADGQHQVSDLVRICDKLINDQLEYCIGVRDGVSYQDPDRKLGKWLLKQAVNFSVGRPVPDFNSGLRGFRRDILHAYLHLLPKGFGASTLTTLLMIERNHYGAALPITVAERKMGKSTVRQFHDGMRTLQIILHIVLLFKPLKFFGIIGLIFIIVGVVYAFIKANINHLGVPISASLLIILGMESFFFGLLCDQISALRRERFG